LLLGGVLVLAPSTLSSKCTELFEHANDHLDSLTPVKVPNLLNHIILK